MLTASLHMPQLSMHCQRAMRPAMHSVPPARHTAQQLHGRAHLRYSFVSLCRLHTSTTLSCSCVELKYYRSATCSKQHCFAIVSSSGSIDLTTKCTPWHDAVHTGCAQHPN